MTKSPHEIALDAAWYAFHSSRSGLRAQHIADGIKAYLESLLGDERTKDIITTAIAKEFDGMSEKFHRHAQAAIKSILELRK